MRLRFWIKGGLQTLATVAGASALYGLLMWVQSSDITLEETLSFLPFYLVTFGAIMLLAMTVSVYKAMLPLALSFGSTRREAFVGLQVFRLLPTAAVALLLVLLFLVPGTEMVLGLSAVVLLTAGLFLFVGAIGSGLGMIYVRFGKLGTILMVVTLLVLGLALGIGAVLGLSSVKFDVAVSLRWLPWLVLATGAAVYLLMLIPEFRTVRKYQIKL